MITHRLEVGLNIFSYNRDNFKKGKKGKDR